MDSHQLINQDSGIAEWYTPAAIIEAARATMGGIDLDPASSAAANETVRAGKFFTAADDGLSRPWGGKVWLNPPFSQNDRFIRKLVVEFEAGRVSEACAITFASLDTAWCRLLMAHPRWNPVGRVAFVPGVGAGKRNAPPKAAIVTYLGPADRVREFVYEFTGRLGGTVDVPWEWYTARLRNCLYDETTGKDSR